MEKYYIKHEDAAIGSILLTDKIMVTTKWGWKGWIHKIDEFMFKHGQGVEIIRDGDHEEFNIHPYDIEYACN